MRAVGRYARMRMAAAVVAPLLLAVTACGSDDDKADKAAASSSAGAGGGASSGTGASKAPSGKVLNEQELKAALVTAQDLPGWDVKTGDPTGAEEDPAGEKADKAECQPILDLIAGSPETKPSLEEVGSVSKADESSRVVHMVAISQFEADKAHEYLAAAAAALPKCATFSGTETDGTVTAYTFAAGKTLPFGEDALTLDYGMDGDAATPVYFTRSGSVIVGAMPLDFSFEDNAPVPTTPEELIRTQFDKVAKAQKG